MKFPYIYIEKLKRLAHSNRNNMRVQPIYAELKNEVVVSVFVSIMFYIGKI